MRKLFEIDKKDYDPDGPVYRRPSARGIIIKGEKVAMVHSQMFDYYKFPGGGIEGGESPEEAMAREVSEETGLTVIHNSIKEYGQVRRIQKGMEGNIFVQDNYYYFCEVEAGTKGQKLDDYEAEEGFSLEYILPQLAIEKNRKSPVDEFSREMLNRDARVLEMLVQEGYFAGENIKYEIRTKGERE